MNYENFTIKTQEALQEASSIANKNDNSEISTEHVLQALIEQQDGLISPIIERIGVSPSEILNKIKETRDKWFEWQITFYASNYADLLATEEISHFHSKFLPFCENLPENVMMETRTKSNNINSLIQYAEKLKNQNKQPTQNLEIAFSLSPRDIATEYEIWTATLD